VDDRDMPERLSTTSDATTTHDATPDTSATYDTSAAHARASNDAADERIEAFHAARLPRAEYRFYRALLLAFPERGGPPDRPTLARLAHDHGVALERTLALLAQEDCVQRDPTTGAIRAAYPFSGVPTPHRVVLPAHDSAAPPAQLYAMCALDALGIPLMLRRGAEITSADALTGDEVRVTLAPSATGEPGNGGAGLAGWTASWEPPTSVIFARREEHDCAGDASGACCPVINFFATAAHAQEWVAAHGAPEGEMLTQTEAVRRAQTLFAGILDRLTDDAVQTR
jgi:hypothetical protein